MSTVRIWLYLSCLFLLVVLPVLESAVSEFVSTEAFFSHERMNLVGGVIHSGYEGVRGKSRWARIETALRVGESPRGRSRAPTTILPNSLIYHEISAKDPLI